MFDSKTAKAAGKIGGKQPKKRDILTQHLIAELNNIAEGDVTNARALVQALIAKAIVGDVAAAREVYDRVEGKAVQINENHNFSHRATELSDDELAGIVADRSSAGTDTPTLDPSKPDGMVH